MLSWFICSNTLKTSAPFYNSYLVRILVNFLPAELPITMAANHVVNIKHRKWMSSPVLLGTLLRTLVILKYVCPTYTCGFGNIHSESVIVWEVSQ